MVGVMGGVVVQGLWLVVDAYACRVLPVPAGVLTLSLAWWLGWLHSFSGVFVVVCCCSNEYGMCKPVC